MRRACPTSVVIGLALLLGSGLARVPAQAAAPPSPLIISYAAVSARVAPIWVAEAQGFFARRGLKVQPVFVSSAPVQIAAMASGNMHVGYASCTTALGAAAGGLDLKILAAFTTRVTYDLVARPEIQRPEQLRRKRVGVQSIGGSVWLGAMLGLERFGLDPQRDQINIMVVGDQATLSQALEAGRIDATVVDAVFSRRLARRGFTVLAELHKEPLPILFNCLVVRRSFIDQHSDAVDAMLRALVEGLAFALDPANKAALLPLLQARLRLPDLAAAEEGYGDILRGMTLRPYPSIEGLRNVQRLFGVRNPKVLGLRPEDVLDLRFYQRLEQEGVFEKPSRGVP